MRLHRHDEIVEAMAERMWQADAIRASGNPRREDWMEVNGSERTRWRSLSAAALDAMLKAVVDLGVGRGASALNYECDSRKEWTAETAYISESMWVDRLFPAIILRMEASDDN